MARPRTDLTGTIIGNITVMGYSRTANKTVYYNCKCNCGKDYEMKAANIKLSKGEGCIECSRSRPRVSTKIPVFKIRLYRIWYGMIYRCNNKSAKKYSDYGKRGILVCEEWLDYESFKKWALENGYENVLTIDRINVNGNYEPNNCRWTTSKVQMNNRRNNVFITKDGVTKTLTEWTEQIGISYDKVKYRVKKGNTIEKALFG